MQKTFPSQESRYVTCEQVFVKKFFGRNLTDYDFSKRAISREVVSVLLLVSRLSMHPRLFADTFEGSGDTYYD